MTPIVVATRSAHKLREIRQILGDEAGLRLVDLEEAGVPPSPEEDGIERYDSFEENALAKARYFAGRARAPVLADDSGLVVDALGGEPGVRSKRFSGRSDLLGAELDRANNEHLLERLRGVPLDRRTAYYYCVVAIVRPDGSEHLAHGRCDGLILERPSGTGGFGYDPLFFLPQLQATFAEIPAPEKNSISHRARAIHAAAPLLRSLADPSFSPPPGA